MGPCESHAVSVQEHAREPEPAHLGIEPGVAVLLIAGDRVAGVRGVHADLMRAARVDRHLDERGALADLHRRERGDRRFTGSVRTHGALTADAQIRAQRHVDALAPQLPPAGDEREISLLELPLAKQRVQLTQGRWLARDELYGDRKSVV